MSATVRCFAFPGMISLPVSSYSGGRGDNAVWVLKQPYLAAETITATGTAATSGSELSANGATNLLRIEVEQGKRVRYEVTPYGHDARVATSDSPVLYGEETLHFGPNWTISLIEDA